MLTASAAEGGFFVLVAGEGVTLDVQAAGRELAGIMGGRGGGSCRTFQGKVTTFADREAALDRLVSLVGGT